MFTMSNVAIVTSLAISLLLVYRFFIGPLIESLLWKRKCALVNEQCPLQLVKVFWKTYRKADGTLEVPKEVRRFLEEYFGREVVYEVEKAVREERISLYVDSWKEPGIYGGIKYKYLAAGFEEGEIIRAHFFEPRGCGKMGL